MINAIRHTGIVVRNLEKSAKFYCALGFVKDNQATEEGIFIDTVVGMENTKLAWQKITYPLFMTTNHTHTLIIQSNYVLTYFSPLS